MKLLITGALQYNEECFNQIRKMGYTIVFVQDEKDPIPVSYEEIEGVICNGLFLHHPIERFINLKYIQLTSAGYDRVPMDYVNSHKITIHNARGVYSIPMAEFALSSVLSVYKHINYFRTAQAEHSWNKHRGLKELYGKRVCIVGCGSVGNECAKRFAAMGCKVYGVDTSPRVDTLYSTIFPINNLHSALSTADVLVLALPLTPQTYHMMGEKELNLLPEDSVIVNIARGGIIDTTALINTLKKREITAILDVFEEEPLSKDSPLWTMENVIMTPHNSFVGEGNFERLFDVVISNLQ